MALSCLRTTVTKIIGKGEILYGHYYFRTYTGRKIHTPAKAHGMGVHTGYWIHYTSDAQGRKKPCGLSFHNGWRIWPHGGRRRICGSHARRHDLWCVEIRGKERGFEIRVCNGNGPLWAYSASGTGHSCTVSHTGYQWRGGYNQGQIKGWWHRGGETQIQ